MNILDRYIAKHILSACLFVLGIIIGLDLLLSLSDKGDEFSQSDDVWQVVLSVLYNEPLRAYQSMPMVLLLGAILGLGGLANTGELTVIRAAGVSLNRLAFSVMKATMPLLIVGVLLGEYVVPWTQQAANTEKIQQGGSANSLIDGFWLKQEATFLRAKGVSIDNQLLDVYLYEYKDMQWRSTVYAKTATFHNNQWQLNNGYQQTLVGDRIESSQFAQRDWPIDLSVDLVKKLSFEPSYLSAVDLLEYSQYLEGEGVNADTFTLVFWKKFFQPLFSLSLIFVAMSFAYTSQRAVPIGQQIFLASLLGLGLNYAQDILGPASSLFGFSPVMAYATPVLLCALLAVFLLRRVR